MTELVDVRDDEHARLVRSSEHYHGHILDVVADDIELASTGASITREYIRHDDAVGILAVRDGAAGEEVLLIRQYRHPVRSLLWEIPAGLLDIEGEDKAVAAARELGEETDYEAESLTPLASFYTSPGCSDELLHVYLARGVSPSLSNFAREDEEAEIETHWFPFEDVAAAVLAGKLHSPSLVVAVLAYATNR
ncbi:NUDIX domain-containing protein [Ancrocorticia populi]|uniref:ADP-ribose pyrophosphatase n=1 Tax=Ancrocorticia populi TaxID=2175228 RepID=A0A2V1K5R8_9ACTO|nr:NUDIX hydrolase [Ancrocorticia populi]PWF26665.1 ADP-ribose pyrophosphatase [Ancrocorticia populi]